MSTLCLWLAGCVQTRWQSAGYGQTQTMRTADETMDVELTDRVHRFERLARLHGVIPPQIEEVVVPADHLAGANRPIPVIRVTFDEADFFDPGRASPRAEAAPVLRVLAENMHRDVPDIRVTVLGHTDAAGSDQANQALSQNRALGVVQALVAAGVNAGQLSAVAIGGLQPVAPNATLAGRARNRRVEFLISPNEQANLAMVSMRPINVAYLAFEGSAGRSPVRHAAVLKPTYAGPADFSEAPDATRDNGRLVLAASGAPLIVGHDAPRVVGDDASGSPVVNARRAAVVGRGETGSPVGPAAASFRPAPP